MPRAYVLILLLAGDSLLFGEGATSTVRARLHFANGFCDPFAHVELVSAKGSVAEGTPDEHCEVVFARVSPGKYELKASGQNFSDTDSVVASSPWTEQFPVIVKPSKPGSSVDTATNSLVSAADLRIPAKAQKEFARANMLASHQEFDKAIQNLKHAIAIYPAFAGAYNSLGVIYARLGEREQGREAFQTAVALNDHFPTAYMNLASTNIEGGNFTDAEAASRKASALNPSDPAPLQLLAFSQLMKGNFDGVTATTRRAHALASPHAFVHHIAAQAFEQQGNRANAIVELETFLREEPTGVRANEVRDELERIRGDISINDQHLTGNQAW